MAGNAQSTRCAGTVMMVAFASAMLLVTATAMAVTVDGRVTPADGYTIMKDLSFTVEKTAGTQTGAALWLHQDSSGDLFVAMSLPRSLVDNSYGLTRIGWGAKNHAFQELVGSDDARFVIKNDAGQTLFDVTMDYLHGLGSHKEDSPFVGGETEGGEFEIVTGSALDIQASTTSLASNWDRFGDDYPGYFGKDSDSPAADPDYANSALSGWLYDVTYEFHLAGAAFANSTIDLLSDESVTIPMVHASPNKIGGNKVQVFRVTEVRTEVVPEPVTLAGLVLGVGSLAGYLRRRTR